jgi:hypothetical protein
MRTVFYCRLHPLSASISLHITAEGGLDNREFAVAEPVVFKKLTPEERDDYSGRYLAPSLTLDRLSGQQLMDELWQCGLRPSEGTGSAGQLAAVQQHLGDMRKIVAAKLEVPL